MLFSAVFTVSTTAGGFGRPISDSTVLMDVAFWKFSNNLPNYASVADSMTLFIMLNSAFTGPFHGGIACTVVFYFIHMKNIHLI